MSATADKPDFLGAAFSAILSQSPASDERDWRTRNYRAPGWCGVPWGSLDAEVVAVVATAVTVAE